MGGSYALYFSTADAGVWGTTNNGEFVQPPIAVADLKLLDHSDTPHVHGDTWWVWLVQQGDCTATCQDTLTKMRNMHVLLNKDAERLRRAVINANLVANGQDSGDYEIEKLRADFPKLFQLRQMAPAPVSPGIYIVDPLGNLVFRYAADGMGKPVLQDLKRLLKVSQIG